MTQSESGPDRDPGPESDLALLAGVGPGAPTPTASTSTSGNPAATIDGVTTDRFTSNAAQAPGV
jgi:hypothetical protein